MNPVGNTILITGGGSGIGRGLAEELQRLGNHVIIAGRRQSVLDETTKANPGMGSMVFDIEHAGGIRSFVPELLAQFPKLNVVINNAGIMRPEMLLEQQEDLADAESIIATNLLGPIRLIAALIPHFKQQPNATIANVSSGLAFVPLAATPMAALVPQLFLPVTGRRRLRAWNSQNAGHPLTLLRTQPSRDRADGGNSGRS